jgi:hypothetical protein
MSALRRVWTYLLLSLAAGVFVIAIVLLGGDGEVHVSGEDRVVLGMALLVLIALGVLSALRPNWWRRATAGREGPEGPSSTDGNGVLPGPPRRGHHPGCEGFASHTIKLRGKVRCAGCTGLVAGALPVALLVGPYMASSSVLEPVEGSSASASWRRPVSWHGAWWGWSYRSCGWTPGSSSRGGTTPPSAPSAQRGARPTPSSGRSWR